MRILCSSPTSAAFFMSLGFLMIFTAALNPSDLRCASRTLAKWPEPSSLPGSWPSTASVHPHFSMSETSIADIEVCITSAQLQEVVGISLQPMQTHIRYSLGRGKFRLRHDAVPKQFFSIIAPS